MTALSTALRDLFGFPVPVERRVSTGFAHESRIAETVEWFTPPWIFDALGLRFDLDCCAPRRGVAWVPADRYYALPVDGCSAPWSGRVWCNPPYGDEVGRWLARMSAHRNGVAFVYARTDVAWFHAFAATADALLFLRGRVAFVPSDSTGKGESGGAAGSVLIAWGEDNVEALRRMSAEGWFVAPERER